MARFHRLELIARTWRSKGPVKVMNLILKSLRDVVLGQHRTLFVMTDRTARRLKVDVPRGFVFRCYRYWDEVPAAQQAEIKAMKRYLWWDAEALLSTGARLWVGLENNRPLTFAMTRDGDKVDVYFFPMTETCTLVSHCVTLPSARGRGLYVLMLQHIARTMAEQGRTRIYIDCTDFNFASERGIRRAGYSQIGHGVHRRSGAVLWRQETPPSVTRLEDSSLRSGSGSGNKVS